MPSLKDYEKNKKRFKASKVQTSLHEKGETSSGGRRPRKVNQEDVSMQEESGSTGAEYIETLNTEKTPHQQTASEKTEIPSRAEARPEEEQLSFYGSEYIKQNAPQVFDVMEAVAKDWVADGDFRAIPLANPWAQLIAAESLQRAKKIEKKLNEKGILPMVKMGFELIKSKMKK